MNKLNRNRKDTEMEKNMLRREHRIMDFHNKTETEN